MSPPKSTSTLFVESYANDSFCNAVGVVNGYWAFQSGPGSSANGVPDTNGCTPPGDAEEDDDAEEGEDEVGVVVSSATVEGVIRDATGSVTVEPSDRTILIVVSWLTTESSGPDATGVLSTVTGAVAALDEPVEAFDTRKADGNTTATVAVTKATTTTIAKRPR